MNIDVQSCSIDVPGKCPNHCKCCVSELHKNKKFMNNILGNCSFIEEDWRYQEYRSRLAYVREKTDTAVLTGTASEPVFNKSFLMFFNRVNKSLPAPFYNIEIQSAGIGMDDDTLVLLRTIGVKTIALSLFSIDSKINSQIQQSPEKLYYDIRELCNKIRSFGFNLRLCYNLNIEGFGQGISPTILVNNLIDFASMVEADQITFRKLYHNNDDNFKETVWVKENQLNDEFYAVLQAYIKDIGSFKRTLTFGADLYTIKGMSTVIDNDCMAKDNTVSLKYLIIRRNIKIYSDWDDEGSLIF